jgi:predicted DNA-binding transcriptional regulator
LGSIVDLYLEAIGIENGFTMPIISPWTEKNWGFDIFSWRLFVVLPLWLLVVLICIIAIWIGYSMLTTPAPVPLEELEEELEAVLMS